MTNDTLQQIYKGKNLKMYNDYNEMLIKSLQCVAPVVLLRNFLYEPYGIFTIQTVEKQI